MSRGNARRRGRGLTPYRGVGATSNGYSWTVTSDDAARLMAGQTPCMRCGSDRCELFRVSDAVWSLAGFGPADVACVACTEQLLGRSLGLPDLMPFPWWGMNRPHYYRGVIDGARGAAEGTHPDYLAGASLGKRLAAHSTPDEVERFVAPFVRPRS